MIAASTHPHVRKMLLMAAHEGDAQLVQQLLHTNAAVDTTDACGEPLTMPKNKGGSLLFIAARQGHLSTMQLLLSHGATVDLPKDGGATPLYIASQSGHNEAVELLLSAGASVDTKAHDGSTAL